MAADRPTATYAQLHRYFQQWTWPRALASPRDLFCPRHATAHHSHGALTGTASEALSAFPVLVRYFGDIVASSPAGPALEREISSFLAVCDVLDLLQTVSRGSVSPEALQRSIWKHLRSYQLAYGTAGWLPKHHASVHLPAMLEAHGTLLSCFTHERRHKLVRRYSSNRRNLAGYEQGIMEDVALQQLHDIDHHDWRKEGLLKPRDASAKLCKVAQDLVAMRDSDSVRTSAQLVARGCTISKGDICIVAMQAHWPCDARCPLGGWACGEVWFHFEVDRQAYSCISVWKHLRSADRSAQFVERDAAYAVKASELMAPVICCRAQTCCTILVPPSYR